MSSPIPRSNPTDDEYKPPWDPINPPTSMFPYLLTELHEENFQKRWNDPLIEHLDPSPSRQSANEESRSGNEREPQETNPPNDSERGPQEPSPSAGNEARSPERSPTVGSHSAPPVQEGDIVINMEDTVHSILGLTDIYDELSALEITSREWKLLKDMPQMYLQSAMDSMDELGKAMKVLLEKVLEAPVPSRANSLYQTGMELSQTRIGNGAKDELRNMLKKMHEEWKTLEKDQDGVPKDMPLYSEKMRTPMRNAISKISQAVENFIYKEFRVVDDSDYKRGAKWYFKFALKVMGVLIGIALTLSTDGFRKLLKLDQRAPQVTVNLTINTGSAASAGTSQATEGQFPAPANLNLNLDALSLGENQNPIYIEVRQTAPSDKKKAAPPDNDKGTVRYVEDL